MGCDIHIYTEKLIHKKWYNIDHFKFRGFSNDLNDLINKKLVTAHIYDRRDYNLFSVLANVRNNHTLNYISKPKGIPNNISDVVLEKYNSWGSDAHSASYLSLSEIKSFLEVNPKIVVSGWVSPDLKKQITAGEIPKENMLDMYDFHHKLDNTSTRETFFVKNTILDELIENIERRKEEEYIGLDENIRIVFWFDN